MIAKNRDDIPEITIDFNKIIPQPETEEECPDIYKRTEDDHIVPYDDKPWFNWYKWNCDNWGTKWGACSGYTIIGKSYVTFVFSTAWSFANPIVNKLSLLGYDIEVEYADEDWGSNYGRWEYTASTDNWEDTGDDIKNPQEFAKNLWEKY